MEDAKIASIDVGDIAEVAATILTTAGHEGKIYPLTGPEALTMAEVAERLSAVTGKRSICQCPAGGSNASQPGSGTCLLTPPRPWRSCLRNDARAKKHRFHRLSRRCLGGTPPASPSLASGMPRSSAASSQHRKSDSGLQKEDSHGSLFDFCY